MTKQIISTDTAPSAIGPYSQAVKTSDTIYLSGQIPLDPNTMMLVSGDFEAQARQVLSNLSAVSKAAGASLSNAVKAVQVSALPKGAMLEIDAILTL